MAVIKATVNLDMINANEPAEVDDALLKEAPLKGLIEQGYIVVVSKADQSGDEPRIEPTQEVETTPAAEETPQARNRRASKNTE